MTTVATAADLRRGASSEPLPWRRMAWVTWCQHRGALIGVALLFLTLAVGFWVGGLQLHHAYAVAVACHPASSYACNTLVDRFNGTNDFLANGGLPQLIPPLIGAFLGAPVLARELESGTFRFAWTQGFGRWRWTLAKLVALGVVVTAVAGALGALLSWYFQPYFPAASQAIYVSNHLSIRTSSPFAPLLFDLRGVAFAAWTLAAFAVGVLAGVLIRRVVAAIVVTLVGYAGIAFAVGGYLRQRYVGPVVTSKLDVPDSAWVISQHWLTKAGRPASQALLNQVLLKTPPAALGKAGDPKSFSLSHYLVQQGFTQWTAYQPASRFWTFQWIEGGCLVALSALLMAGTIWWVRRKVA